jgi:GT2 family glycosyltransferase
VIDNGCNPQVFNTWIRNRFDDLNYISLPFNHGFIRATNLGIAASLLTNSEYVLLMNADTRVEGDSTWLERLIQPMVSDESIGAVGAVSNNVYGQQRRNEPTKLTSYYFVQALIGFCLLLRKEAIAKVGLLDERFEPGNYDDFDYSLRLHKAGYKLAVAESVFIHHEMHASFKELDKTEPFNQLLATNQGKLMEKWGADALKAVGL